MDRRGREGGGEWQARVFKQNCTVVHSPGPTTTIGAALCRRLDARTPLSLPQLHDRPFGRESSLMLSPVPRPTRARTHRMPCALRERAACPPRPCPLALSPHTHTITHQHTELSDTRTHALTHHIHTQIDKTHGSVTASTRSSGSCSRRGRPSRGSACTRTQSSAAGRSRRCTSSARRPGGAGGPSPRR